MRSYSESERYFMKPKMRRDAWLQRSYAASKSACLMYPWSSATYRWLLTSAADDNAMPRNLLNSLRDLRSKPSAMFAITETAARWLWSFRPKSFAKAGRLVRSYTSLVNSRASCHALMSSKRSIFMAAVYRNERNFAL